MTTTPQAPQGAFALEDGPSYDDLVNALQLISHATAPSHEDGAHHETAHDLASGMLKHVRAAGMMPAAAASTWNCALATGLDKPRCDKPCGMAFCGPATDDADAADEGAEGAATAKIGPADELALLKEAFAAVARQWDGCQWEDTADVGASLRNDLARHLRQLSAGAFEFAIPAALLSKKLADQARRVGDLTLYNGSTDEPYFDIAGSDLWCNASDFTQSNRWKIRYLLDAAKFVQALAAMADRGDNEEDPLPALTDQDLQILKAVREYSGYDGYDDASEGVDVVDEVRECLGELAAAAEREREWRKDWTALQRTQAAIEVALTRRDEPHPPLAVPVAGLQPIETVRYWAREFEKDPQRLVGGMIVRLLNEYAALRILPMGSALEAKAVQDFIADTIADESTDTERGYRLSEAVDLVRRVDLAPMAPFAWPTADEPKPAYWLAPMELPWDANFAGMMGLPKGCDDHDARECYRLIRDACIEAAGTPRRQARSAA